MSYPNVNTIKFSNILCDRLKREIRKPMQRRNSLKKKVNVPYDMKVCHY